MGSFPFDVLACLVKSSPSGIEVLIKLGDLLKLLSWLCPGNPSLQKRVFSYGSILVSFEPSMHFVDVLLLGG